MCVVGFGRESDQDTRDNTMNKIKIKKKDITNNSKRKIKYKF